MEPNKYKRYGIENMISPINGIFPISANKADIITKKNVIDPRDSEVKIKGRKCSSPFKEKFVDTCFIGW